MAEIKPVAVPIYNTGGANRVEPIAAKKITGWVVDEEPPSSFFNWLLFFGGEWDEWANERLFDGLITGGDAEDFLVTAPVAVMTGGQLTLKGGDAGTAAGFGGGFLLQGGVPGLTGESADCTVKSADGGATSGDSGNLNIRTGDVQSTNIAGSILIQPGTPNDSFGISAELSGGDATGTDVPGGIARLSSGRSTGALGSDVDLQVAVGGASGTAFRNPSTKFSVKGTLERITGDFPMLINSVGGDLTIPTLTLTGDATLPVRGPLLLAPANADPSAPAGGEVAVGSDTGRMSIFDANAARWGRIQHRIFNIITSEILVDDLSVDQAFTTNVMPIPANTLRVGSSFRIKAWVDIKAVGAAGTFNVGLSLGDSTVPSGAQLGAATAESFTIPGQGFFMESEVVVIGPLGAACVIRSFFTASVDIDGGGAVSPSNQGITNQTIDTTIANEIFVNAGFSVNDAGNELQLFILNVDMAN